jgi:hypothetical protein
MVVLERLEGMAQGIRPEGGLAAGGCSNLVLLDGPAAPEVGEGIWPPVEMLYAMLKELKGPLGKKEGRDKGERAAASRAPTGD